MFAKIVNFVSSNGLLIIPALVALVLICGGMTVFGLPRWAILTTGGVIIAVAVALFLWLHNKTFV